MDHLLTCDQCGKQHTVGKSQAGQEIPCECGNAVQVPTLRDFAALPKAAREDHPPTSESRKEVWQSWRGPTIAVAATGFAIAFGYTLWFLLQLSMLDTSHNAESEISMGNELFDTYSPEELSLVWNSYESVGVGQKDPPPFELIRQYALARKYLAGISGSIATVFAFAMLAILISARRAKKR